MQHIEMMYRYERNCSVKVFYKKTILFKLDTPLFFGLYQ